MGFRSVKGINMTHITPHGEQKLTPLMAQYWEMKAQHPDKILLFRMGDFFEMFHEDARVAAPILNIALTQRNKKSADDTPMCGVPHHSIAGPILKLLAAGKKIAICDQIEDPKLAKGLVKRAVTRCLSPGMVYDPDTLDQLVANYLCAYDDETVSFLEPTTGETFFYRLGTEAERRQLLRVLCPVELVMAEGQAKDWFEEEMPHAGGGFTRSTHQINHELLNELAGKKSIIFLKVGDDFSVIHCPCRDLSCFPLSEDLRSEIGKSGWSCLQQSFDI